MKDTRAMEYTVRYFKEDRRTYDKCRIVHKSFYTEEEAMKYISTLTKVIGDSVELYHSEPIESDKYNLSVKHILIGKKQMSELK